ncbi:MAG TPA: transposase [Flavobacteriaceae bacterium]|nr:transposase [Flavobacteriaceae bacterium]
MGKINYKALYLDILNETCPEKKSLCDEILNKSSLTSMDVIALNKIIFNNSVETHSANQKFKSYSEEDIQFYLDYQTRNKLNNSELARIFNMSRNTVHKWKEKSLLMERNDI